MQPVKPLNELIIELSYNCNLACTMCGFGGGRIRAERFMRKEMLTRILDAVGPPPKTIRLNGRGESTIHPDFTGLLWYVRNRFPNSGINLFTHFSTVKPKVLDAIIECGVQIFISVDSPNAERHAAIRRGSRLADVVANIERLAAVQNRPFIIFTLQELNFDDVVPIARFALERNLHLLVNTVRRDEGIEHFQHMVEQRVQYLKAAFDEVERLFEKTQLQCILPDQVQGIRIRAAGPQATYGSREKCPAVTQELCVLYDGTATPCNMFNPYVYGNLLEENLAQLRSGERYQWFLKNHKKHYYCANCACLGGTS